MSRSLASALRRNDALIVSARKILNKALRPHGLSKDRALFELLSLLDGPRQRAVRAATREALAVARRR